MSKKSKFNFGTEKISWDEQYILGSDSGQMETRTVNALFVEMQHMEQYCCEISEAGIDKSLALERKIESRKRNFSLDLENLIVSISLSTLDFREW